MTFKSFFLTFVALLVFALPATAAEKKSIYDQIMERGTIRCGYYVFPPMAIRDAATGKMSGLAVDLIEEIAKRTSLKIEWTEEVTFSNWAPALQANRFDALCTPMWPEMAMMRVVSFSDTLFYSGMSPLVRAEDERFKDNDLNRLNQSDVTFLVQDGSVLESLTRAAFPKAKIKSLAANLDGPSVIQEIITKKADAILLDRNAEIAYNKNNPVKLKLIAADKPVLAQPFTFFTRREEAGLRDFFDEAIEILHSDGTIERILTKWEPEPNTFLRVAKPYEAVK